MPEQKLYCECDNYEFTQNLDGTKFTASSKCKHCHREPKPQIQLIYYSVEGIKDMSL